MLDTRRDGSVMPDSSKDALEAVILRVTMVNSHTIVTDAALIFARTASTLSELEAFKP
jgi:hypothetical protein